MSDQREFPSPAGPMFKRWGEYWFQPSGPGPLAVCRILFFGILSLYYARFDASAWGDVDPVFLKPIVLFRLLGLPVASTATLLILQTAWKVSLVTSCLGLCTRISTLVAWLLGFYLLGVVNCFGKISHQHQSVVLVLGILALSRCGDFYSFDRWWRGNQAASRPDLVAGGAYTWPVKLTWLVFVSVFFAAGIAKLRISGLNWVWSDNFSHILIRAHYGTERVWNQWGLDVARQKSLCQVIAACVLLLELASPAALFSSSARRVVVPLLLLMQAGIYILMGTSFTVFIALYAFWIPTLLADVKTSNRLNPPPEPRV